MLRICVILLSAAVAGCSDLLPVPPSSSRPIVTSVSPARGSTAGGTPVTIIGSGFQVGATVSLGGARQVVSFGGTTILYMRTVAHDAGVVEMVVTGPQGQAETFPAAFEYASPPTFDFNGSWEGIATRDAPGPWPRSWHQEIRVGVTGNVVTSINITCDGGAEWNLPAPLVVGLGGFSLTAGDGTEIISGRIVSDRHAIGTFDTAACGASSWTALRK